MENKVSETAIQPWSKGNYHIKVFGQVPEDWLHLCAGMDVKKQEMEDQSAVTCLTGQMKDQSHLLGLLNALADWHFPILAVERID